MSDQFDKTWIDDALDRVLRPRPMVQYKDGWSDDKLRDLGRGLHFAPSAYSRNELKKILTRFYYLYCQGCNQAGDNVAATLNDVIAIAETDLGPIWEAPPPMAMAFYTPNVSQTDNLCMVQVGASDNQKLLRRFCVYVGGIIENIDPLGPRTQHETRLVRLTAFLGLTMYRFATKTSRVMANTFKGTQYKSRVESVISWMTPLTEAPFCGPCDLCLTICEGALAQGLRNTSKLFTIVINKYIDTKLDNHVNTIAGEMLAVALLTDTAWYGMGLMPMMQKVTDILDIKWRELRAQCFLRSTMTSWERIGALMNSQIEIINRQYSFRWARVIDHNYFRELALKENRHLATVFSAVLAEVEGQGVWRAAWAKQIALSEDLKYVGMALYEINISKSKP